MKVILDFFGIGSEGLIYSCTCPLCCKMNEGIIKTISLSNSLFFLTSIISEKGYHDNCPHCGCSFVLFIDSLLYYHVEKLINEIKSLYT